MAAHSSTHPMITASRVTGTPVFNQAGESIGSVHDLSIDKVTGQVHYALIRFGGFLGIAERYQTLPWSSLAYDPQKAGYVVDVPKRALDDAPSLSPDELEELGAGRPWDTPFVGVPMI